VAVLRGLTANANGWANRSAVCIGQGGKRGKDGKGGNGRKRGKRGKRGKHGKLGKVRVFFWLKITKHGWAVRDHG
jgi:hypothetical protein